MAGEYGLDEAAARRLGSAKENVEGLARAIGFEPIDVGPLARTQLLDLFAFPWITRASAGESSGQGFGRDTGLVDRAPLTACRRGGAAEPGSSNDGAQRVRTPSALYVLLVFSVLLVRTRRESHPVVVRPMRAAPAQHERVGRATRKVASPLRG